MTAQPLPLDRRNVWLYYAFGFFMDFALWAGVWIKYLIDVRGFELKWLLFMDLPFWLLVAVLQAPTGALADHIGRRKVLVLGAVLFSITVLGFGLTTNYWMLFFDYVIWAFAMSLRSGTDQALIYDSLKASGHESRFQRIVARGFASTLIAGMVGVALGGVLADRFGLALMVQVSAIPPLLAACVAFAMREPPVRREERHYWRSLGAGLTFAWKQPQLRYTLLIGSVLLTGTFGPVILVQPFLLNHDVSTALYGIYQAPLRLTSVVAALLAGWVGSRTQTGRIIVLACATIITAYIGLAAVPYTAAFVLFALPSLVSGLTNPIISGHLNERIPSERRATVLSVMQLCFSLQVAFFEPALGYFADDISLKAAFAFAGAYFLVLMPPLLILWRRAHGLERSESVAVVVAESAGGG